MATDALGVRQAWTTMNAHTIELIIRIADVTGVVANAILGGLIARSQRFDPVGFLTLAIMTGLGGGVLRDVMLQAGPPVMLTDPAYLTAAMSGAAIAFFVPVGKRLWNFAFPYLDALALGCWAAAGASKTMNLGLGVVPAIIMGTITAVGGGVMRDVMLQKTPSVFGGNTLYATPAILASSVLAVLHPLGIEPLTTLIAILAGMLLTLIARWRQWRLPESYSWSTKRALAVLPRPRWRRLKQRHKSPKPDAAPDGP